MVDLNFDLHTKQAEVFQSRARFRVCAAGRRFGKSYLSAIELLINGLQEVNKYGYPLNNKEVWYIAPTFAQGKDIMWNLLKDIGHEVIASALENTATLKLINGRTIKIKGSDRPDTLRGVGVAFVVLDEYAFMKPEVWDLIIRPTLADVMGSALFIGTPDGKNHFYDTWLQAETDEDWESFMFNSTDNPVLPLAEIEAAGKVMTQQAFRQEFEASFEAAGGGEFRESEFIYMERPPESGPIYIAVDPAGFTEGKGKLTSKMKRADETAIAVVETSESGWFVHDVIYGRWGVRETSLQIIKACKTYKPTILGIENGSLKNAILPYLSDQMRRLNIYPRIEPLTHGGQNKTKRIAWALQGRFQNGKIFFKEGASYLPQLRSQLLDFPNPMVHDDLIDALAYIDQLAKIPYFADAIVQNEFEPLDPDTGY